MTLRDELLALGCPVPGKIADTLVLSADVQAWAEALGIRTLVRLFVGLAVKEVSSKTAIRMGPDYQHEPGVTIELPLLDRKSVAAGEREL